MKIKFLNAENIADGISLVAEELGFKMAENGDYTIKVIEQADAVVSVSVNGKNAEITYGGGKARFFRGLAYAVKWLKNGENKEIKENPLFNTNGAMFDMSKIVMNVKTTKNTLKKMALMGLNCCMLYTEDTYEVPEYPYFGHLRGRYTKEELKELDKYALELGIELIPCIQTLGHLATFLKWRESTTVKDGETTLLVGEEETYKLIDAMFKTLAECFTTRRLHVGMDETFDLGTGRSLSINGYRDKEELYFEHLARVRDIAKKYGFKPMMWSDMFFRLAGEKLENYGDYDVRVKFDEETRAKIPQGVQPVFWDYYHDNEEFYAKNIVTHREVFEEETLFAGAVWLWNCHSPLFRLSLRNTLPALEACKKHNLKQVIATIWGGNEASIILGLVGLAWYASFDYSGEYDIDKVRETFENACNVSYDKLFSFNLLEGSLKGIFNGGRELLYNDPLLGMADIHFEGNDIRGYYEKLLPQLQANKVEGLFAPACETMVSLASLLVNKGAFSLDLKKAYDEKNISKLKELADECDTIIEKLNVFKNSFKKMWYEYNKPFGLEVIDIRYGGMVARFETVKERIQMYLDGKIDVIEELDAPRLPIVKSTEGDFINVGYSYLASANVL